MLQTFFDRAFRRGTARLAIVVITLMSMVGCTSLQTVEPPYSQSLAANVEVGSDVQIVTTDSRTYKVHVIEVAAAGIRGNIANSDNRTYLFRYEQIKSISQKQVDGVKTGLTVAAIIAGVAGLAYLAARIFLRGLDN